MAFPEEFERRMQATLKATYEAFLKSYDRPPCVGLKVNTQKIDVETFVERFPYRLTPVPWATDGFYYNPEDPVTKHPYFYAGLYYIQEPSAMAPANILKPSPGDTVLDLCAAPGGKSMQLSNFIEDDGLLVSNDINETRIKAVLRNAERFGIRNIVVLNDAPDKIAKIIGRQFDAVLVDAPCSGEGMFKKDPKAERAWHAFGPTKCAEMQREILASIPEVVVASARMVYATCTFAPEENEDQMKAFTDEYEVFKPLNITSDVLTVDGHMARIWPHLHDGEGHFFCALKVEGAGQASKVLKSTQASPVPPVFEAFMKAHIAPGALPGCIEVSKDKVYLRPERRLPLKGLRVVREGLLLGELKKNRFVPSQALAMALTKGAFEPTLDLSSDSLDVVKYLKGETLQVEAAPNGLHLVCVDGYPLGFGKVASGMLKNMYPASWRMM